MAEQALVADLRINLTKFDADLKKAMQTAEKASAGISKAFDKVGDSVRTLPTEFNKLNDSLKQTEQATKRAADASDRQMQVLGKLKGALGAIGLAVGAQEMVKFALSTVKAAEALTSVENQFVLLTGSQKAAKAEMAFIRAECDRLALSTVEAAKGYARMANAAEGTKLEGEAVRQVFMGLNTITRALSLSQEEYGRILNQVTQIISKGKIQTEELITLSESGIPIFTMLAKSMGVSGQALADMLEQGKVSSQALILVIDEVQKRYAALAEQASQTVPAQIERGWNRVYQEVTDVVQGILKSGELLNAFKFESNALDIFPDRETITANVDYIIRQYTAISMIVEAAFKQTLNSIKNTFRNIVSSLQGFLTPIGDFFKNLPGASWVGEQFQALVGGLQDADNQIVQAKQNTDEFKGLFFEIFGGEGQTAIQRWDDFVKKAFDKFGLEMPSPINSEKIATDAAAANQELMKLQEQAKKDMEKLQEEARKKKREKDVATEEEAMKTIASMRRKLEDDEFKEQERRRKELIESTKEAEKAIQKMREGLIENEDKEKAKTHEAFLKILERTNQERIGQEQAAADEFNKTIDNMKENIQKKLADAISGAIRGDMGNIKDALSTIRDMFADIVADLASEFISAFAIDPIIDKLKPLIAKLKGLTSGQGGSGAGGISGAGGGGGGIMGQVGGGVAAVGAGIGVGMGVSQMAGGGKMGGALGGAAGGAMAGAMIGMIGGPVVALVGAAVGAVVGGIAGFLASKSKEKTEIISQTTPGMPSSQKGGATSYSPFGIVSLFEKSKVSDEVANNATMAIAEIDGAIAKYLNTQQRAIVEDYFQSAVPEGSTVASKEAKDAIAKAVQLRLYHALTALEGEGVAKNVVGEAYSATASSIQGIQQRAMEALGILETLADFKEGDLSQTAQQIKAINDQFQQLSDRAVVLGLPTDDIAAEQQKQLAKITSDFNEGIGDAILGISDPAKLEFVQLERMQEERMQSAIDAGADLAQVEKLNQLEREELEKKHQGNLTTITEQGGKEREAATAGIFQAIYSITDPLKASILGIQQQVAAFQAQADAGLIPQSLVDRFENVAMEDALERSREARRQEAQAVEDFNNDVYDSILGLKDSYAVELAQMDRMHEERYQKALEIGGDINAVAQLNHAERLQLEQAQQDELTRIALEKKREGEEAVSNIFQAIYGITDPLKASILGIQQQVAAFQAQADQGLIPQSLVDRYEDTAMDQAREQEMARREEEARAVEDFNNQIYDSLLALKDSYAVELEQMDRMHEERYQKALEMGADINAVAQLNHAERLQLEQEHQDELTRIAAEKQQEREAALNNVFQMIWQIEDPFRAVLLGIEMQIAQLQEQVDAGIIPQSVVDRYEDAALEQAHAQEQQRRQQEAQTIMDFNNQITASIMGMTDTYMQESMEMELMHQDRIRRAEELGADLAAVDRLNQMEREQLLLDHEERKKAIEEDAQRASENATNNIMAAILGIEDPFMAAMFNMQQQVAAFQAQADQGLIPQNLVDRYQRAAHGQIMQQEQDRKNREAEQRRAEAQRAAEQRRREAEQRRAEAQRAAEQRRREAEQRKREAQQRAEQKKREAEQRKREAEQKKQQAEQEAERRRQAGLQFRSALLAFTDPFAVSLQQINEQVREFRKFASEGIISNSAVDQFRRLALASLEVEKALQAISGGSNSPIEQVGAAFEAFIKAGGPEQSQSVQKMAALQEQFSGLVEAADILGLSTEELEKSYLSQAKTIREEAIDAINKEMEAKKKELGQIDEFLAKMRMSDVLPEKMRFDEARAQFGEAVKGGDVQKAVSASEQYLNIAQERFGSTQQFFSARNEVERMLTHLRDQQTRNIESEHAKAIRQEERQLEQVKIARSNVEYLRRISTDNSDTNRGIGQLIAIARSQTAEQVQTRQLLLRLAAKIKA